MRDKIAHLVSLISSDIPGLTLHDITHLDSLWDTASIIAEGAISLNPAEGFVFGASVYLHDAALTVAAYPGGLNEITNTRTFKDILVQKGFNANELPISLEGNNINLPPKILSALSDTLRRLHAEKASTLAGMKWNTSSGDQFYLIDDTELRTFYGPMIGEIATSHWHSVSEIETRFQDDGGAFAQRTHNTVSKLSIACLLRVADALHIDSRRAPLFLKALIKPTGVSDLHWNFQSRLSRARVESDAIAFTSGASFRREDAESWWLAYDMLTLLHRELSDVDLALSQRGKNRLRARRVKAISSPNNLARLVETQDWSPIDARIQISDVPKIVNSFGGSALYGDDPKIPLRELIQNSLDAVQARRLIQNRPQTWGEISVEIQEKDSQHWLIVEDNGIGMSENVLTTTLLDFGTSFWSSRSVTEEFPGLVSAGLKPIGRFGIGFFSVFMIGDLVRVTSKRFDYGNSSARTIELGLDPRRRPIIWSSPTETIPVDGGTRVEIQLRIPPHNPGGLLTPKNDLSKRLPLAQVVALIAPCSATTIKILDDSQTTTAIEGNDWKTIPTATLLNRLNPNPNTKDNDSKAPILSLLKSDNGTLYGRASLCPWSYSDGYSGFTVVGGLRSQGTSNLNGVLLSETTVASRNSSTPLIPLDVLRQWASLEADIASTRRMSDARKAHIAEVVLQCDGDIKSLPILRWGEDWLSSDEFSQRIVSSEMLYVSFDGEFSFDEDDECHPRDFQNSFELDSEIVIVPRNRGTILSDNGVDWPPKPRDALSMASLLEVRIRKIISGIWSEGFIPSKQSQRVGKVNDIEIHRKLTVFERSFRTL